MSCGKENNHVREQIAISLLRLLRTSAALSNAIIHERHSASDDFLLSGHPAVRRIMIYSFFPVNLTFLRIHQYLVTKTSELVL